MVAEEVGGVLTAEKIKKIASELWANRGKGIVVGGSPSSDTDTGYALQLAINLLNAALQNEGATIDGRVNPTRHSSSYNKLAGLIREGRCPSRVRSEPGLCSTGRRGFYYRDQEGGLRHCGE